MSRPHSRAARAVLALLLLLSAEKGLARDRRPLVHKVPPLSSERADDIIHEFPPLRPIPGLAPPARAPETPRSASTAPTLEEAPRIAYDAPTLAELGVPVATPGAGAQIPDKFGPAEDVLFRPQTGGARLVETRAQAQDEVVPDGLAAARRPPTDLEHFLSPAPQSVVAMSDDALPTTPLDEAASDPISTYLLAAAAFLAALLTLSYVRRRRLRSGAPADAKLARLLDRVRKRKAEDEEPAPPIDLSRISRTARKTPSASASAPQEASAAVPSTQAPPAIQGAAAPTEGAAPAGMDDLDLVEPGDAAAASAAINAARRREEGAL